MALAIKYNNVNKCRNYENKKNYSKHPHKLVSKNTITESARFNIIIGWDFILKSV